jgi:hypothetical protein
LADSSVGAGVGFDVGVGVGVDDGAGDLIVITFLAVRLFEGVATTGASVMSGNKIPVGDKVGKIVGAVVGKNTVLFDTN